MGGDESRGRSESGNLDRRRFHLETVPDIQQPQAVAGVGILAVRVAGPGGEIGGGPAQGKLQTASKSGEWPDGSTGYHTVEVEVL